MTAGGAPGYLILWEFRVAPGTVPGFEQAYGPEGDWVRFFRQGTGFVRTDLWRDPGQPGRYVTADLWRSETDYMRFRARFAAEYAALDRRMEGLAQREAKIGEFVIA